VDVCVGVHTHESKKDRDIHMEVTYKKELYIYIYIKKDRDINMEVTYCK
jgi:hypothetical protein